MQDQIHHGPATTGGDMADHISEARQRARRMLAAEAHVGPVDDARQSIARARDGVLLIWLIWVALHGFGVSAEVGGILVAAGVGLSIFIGLVAAVATRTQLQYYESELERERQEIRNTPEHEREEVRALYAAKGFRPPLLDQITDTICADDDRLLKVMMEEELGFFIHRFNHPAMVGLWHAGGSLVGALALAVPLCFVDIATAPLWMIAGTTVLLAAIALIRGSPKGQFVPMFATSIILGGVTGGLVHFLAGWLHGTG
ncbi:MAG TPA: VIT1/CCC1 transporter family protein [Phycisphaerae bacterium]|nr:VIT1/CCC1 transporter family protein [Phycisphaerae bacterium]